MSEIKPPPKPRGESPKVTIANQDAQIRMLIGRIEHLSKLNDDACARLKQVIAENDRLGMIDSQFRSLQQVHTRMLGWQDCAREVLGVDRAEITIDRSGR